MIVHVSMHVIGRIFYFLAKQLVLTLNAKVFFIFVF